MVKAILTKPLDGDPEGTEREFDQADFDTLKRMGAVREAAAEDAKDAGKQEPGEEAQAGDVKAAAAPQNKMAPEVLNKSAASKRKA